MTDSNVYVVTGTTSGIGKAVAHQLARTGGTVVMVARDDEHGTRVQREISTATENSNIDLQLCDLGNLASVRNLATILNNRYEKIDALVNSASVYKRNRSTTVDGYETMFATNHLGPFLLTYLLLNRLKASGSARIVNVTAPSTTPLDFDDLQSTRHFNAMATFGMTKMANLLFTFELARRLQNTGLMVNAVHPGLVRSNLMKEAFAPIRWISSLMSSPPDRAAAEIARLVTEPEFASMTGKFLHKGNAIEADAYALDPENQTRLWEVSEQLTDARDVVERGANYDPTGSVAMFNEEDIPEEIIRPEDNQTKPGQ